MFTLVALCHVEMLLNHQTALKVHKKTQLVNKNPVFLKFQLDCILKTGLIISWNNWKPLWGRLMCTLIIEIHSTWRVLMEVLAGSQRRNPDVITLKFRAICFHNYVLSLSSLSSISAGFWGLSHSNGIITMWRFASRGLGAPRFWRPCTESTL